MGLGVDKNDPIVDTKSGFLPLSFLYLFVGIVAFVRLCRLPYIRNELVVIQCSFFVSAILWGLVRWCLFFFYAYWQRDSTTCLILYWVPLNVQFASMGLLLPFFMSLLYSNTWEKSAKHKAIVLYALVLIIIAIFCLVTLVLGVEDIRNNNLTFVFWKDTLRSVYTTIVYLFFTCITAYYSYFTRKRIVDVQVFKQWLDATKFTIISLFFLVSLLANFVFHLIVTIDTTVLFQLGEHENFPIAALFILWEIIPEISLLLLLWRVPLKITTFSNTQAIVNVNHARNMTLEGNGTKSKRSMFFNNNKENEAEKPIASTTLFPSSFNHDDYGSFSE